MDQDDDRHAAPRPTLEILGLVVVVSVFGVALGLNAFEARKNRNETRAIGAIRTIATAQAFFREADREQDGNLDYGTLAELANAGTIGLIDPVLGTGTRDGYVFECTYSATTSEFLWFATARPEIPGITGDRYWAINHEGVSFYTTQQPFELNGTDCTIPRGVQPVSH